MNSKNVEFTGFAAYIFSIEQLPDEGKPMSAEPEYSDLIVGIKIVLSVAS